MPKLQFLSLFFALTVCMSPAFATINKIHKAFMSICIEDQPEELCICIANSFKNVLKHAQLNSEELQIIFDVQNGNATHNLEYIDQKINYDMHYENIKRCLDNYEASP